MTVGLLVGVLTDVGRGVEVVVDDPVFLGERDEEKGAEGLAELREEEVAEREGGLEGVSDGVAEVEEEEEGEGVGV